MNSEIRIFLENILKCRSWIVLAVIIFFVATIRIRLLQIPLERDEGEYAYFGQLLLEGALPYKLAYNMKLPGTYGAYALVMAVFGQTTAGVHLGLLAANALATVFLFMIGRRGHSAFAGAAAAAAYALLSVSPSVLGTSAHATHFVTVAALGGVLLLLRALERQRSGGFFWSGVCFGLAFLMKQPGGAFAVFGLLYTLWAGMSARERRPARVAGQAGLVALGAVLPFGIVCLVLAAGGVFSKFWFWTFSYAREYGTQVSIGDGLLMLMASLSKITLSAAGLMVLAALGLTAMLWDRKARENRFFLAGLFCFSFLAICPGLYFRPHYFVVWLPSVGLMAGVGLSALYEMVHRSRTPRFALALLGILAVIAFGSTISQHWEFFFEMPPEKACRSMYPLNPFPESVKLAQYIKAHSSPGDTVGIIGSEPQIPFYAGRRSATGYLHMYPLMENQKYARQMQMEMIRELEQARPRFLVYVSIPKSWLVRRDSDTTILAWADRYAMENYRRVGIAEMFSEGVTAYCWGDEAAGHALRSPFYVLLLERRDAPPRAIRE